MRWLEAFGHWLRGPYCDRCGQRDVEHWHHDLEWVYLGCPEPPELSRLDKTAGRL